MKKYIYTVIAASCAMFASCSQEGEFASQSTDIQGKAITEISASSDAESRAVVSTTDNTKINWQSGDQLGVFSTGTSATAYTLQSGEGTVNGAFTNTSSPVSSITAVMYPYQSTATWDNTNSKLTCNVPSVQTAVKGSFDKSAAIMYYLGDKTNVTLNSAVAFLKVTVTSSEKAVHAITVSSSTPLSGDINITSDGVAPVSSVSELYVTLQASEDDEQALAAGDYYIAVVPGTYKDLAIAYKYTDHTAKAKSDAPDGQEDLTMTVGHVKAISVDFTTGTVRDAVQLWSKGPFFATMNVGATKSTGTGLFFAWGETTGHSGEYASGSDWQAADGYGYDWNTMPFNNGSSSYNATYFNNTGRAEATGSATGTVLLPKYDGATQKWGYAWKIPTLNDCEGLTTADATRKVNYTGFNKTDGNLHYNQAKGTTPNSQQTIDLPIAGSRGRSANSNWPATAIVDNPYNTNFTSNICGRYQISEIVNAKDDDGNYYWQSRQLVMSNNNWCGTGQWRRYMGEYIRAVLR